MDRRNTGVAVSGVGRRDLLRGVLGLPLAYAGGRSVLGASGDDPPNRFDRRPSGLIGRQRDPDNRHRGGDQWLFVVGGEGEAIVEGERVALREGTLVLIRRGQTHEIRNTGRGPMKTLNVYVPPAYIAEGDELPAGRR